MDTNAPSPQDDPAFRAAQEQRLAKTWETPKGWRILSDVNNSNVGVWYTLTALGFMLFGGALALLMRIQLAVPDNRFLPADTYNQFFTMHGTVMMFLFAVPIFEAVAILILPAMVGARDLPFPRLSAFGYWCFIIGGVFVCGSVFFGVAPSGGWFMYPPLTTEQMGVGADIWLLGLSFIEVASIAAAVELIVGVLKCRAPGMHINMTPLYGWYVLIVGGMILFAFPPLIAGDFLFEMERAFHWPFFDASRGGDPLLWQHLFWIFGHPEVYIVFLPSIALLAMIVPTFAKRPIVGYSWIVLSALGTGFISFGLWVHHMFTTGLPALSLGFFSAASEAVVIPTGIQIFVFVSTLLLGTIVRSVPMLFALGAVIIFVIGGLTGVMVALVPFDLQAHDSYFVVAHLHYVLIGGVIFPLMAGVHYYYPFVAGKMLSRRAGIWSFWAMFAGFNIGFMPMHLTGLLGMPRRVFTYPSGLGWDWLNMVSTVGAFIFAAGFLLFVFDLLRPKRNEPTVERNPWGAGTIEWLSKLPGEDWGLRSVPKIESRYPLWDNKDIFRQVDEGRFYLPDAEEGLRETMVTTVLDAQPLQVLRVAKPTWITLYAAAGLGGTFIFSTYHWWWATLASGLLAFVSILIWVWTGTAAIPEKESKDAGLNTILPLYRSGPTAVGWWAMFITMIGDLTAFLSLVFGYYFFWTVHPEFPPLGQPSPGLFWPFLALLLFAFAWGATLFARTVNRQGQVMVMRFSLATGVIAAIGGIAALMAGPSIAGMDPTTHSYPAIVWAMVVWTVLHVGVGIIMQLYCIARSVFKRLTPRYDADIWNVTLYWHAMLFTALVTCLTIGLFPEVS